MFEESRLMDRHVEDKVDKDNRGHHCVDAKCIKLGMAEWRIEKLRNEKWSQKEMRDVVEQLRLMSEKKKKEGKKKSH